MQIFSPFGPVESLKVIPDKECAFVNFMRVEDAMRAKEDISERRGGRIGNATVRVGYGKAELMASADAPVLHPTRALCKLFVLTGLCPVYVLVRCLRASKMELHPSNTLLGCLC